MIWETTSVNPINKIKSTGEKGPSADVAGGTAPVGYALKIKT